MTTTAARLHWHPLSGHAHRAQLMLSLLAREVELVEVDLRSGAHKAPGFVRRNPFGQVPVLEDDGEIVADSNAILVYLALRYDASGQWYPRDPIGAARVQRWLSVAAGQLAAGPMTARLAAVFGLPVDKAKAQADAASLFAVLEAELASGPYLAGPQPTIADVALYTYTAHAPEGGVALDPYPSIRAWIERIEALPGFVPMIAAARRRTGGAVMPDDASGWGRESSPYHPGEMAVQERAGSRALADRVGRRVIRDHMTEQHRAFFSMLPYVFMGCLDRQGRPWATVLSGPAGFLRSPDPRQLRVSALPLPGDPASDELCVGAPVAFLGIELHTRRRNRLTGKVATLESGGFTFSVDQSFGNCPQYIQARAPEWSSPPARPSVRPLGHRLDDRSAEIVSRCDTLFIASASPGAGADDPVEGADVNHRGGRRGFVRVETVEGRSVLTFPDFRGNSAFNTLGNITLNPRAGLLFIDFRTGDLVTLTGRADVIWDGPDLQGFVRAERLVRVRVEEAHHLVAALPWRWTAPEQAPQIQATGDWQAMANQAEP